MRTLIAILIVATTAPAQEKNEAEELFKKMEEKFTQAKTLQLSWKMAAPVKEGEITAEGALVLGEGNKARLDVAAKLPGVDQKDLFVSDGTQLRSVGSRSSTVETPGTFNKTILGCLARGGPVYALTVINMNFYSKESDPSKLITLSAFAMGKKERVGEREAQGIEFKATFEPANRQKSTVKLWIDCETGLPVKRVFVVNEMNQEIVSTETYSGFKLDEKIDASKFELPPK
ncbi:MAG TPA: hypothetical protein VFC90_06185 [Planctomycetota bacterium]|nr:hypothetical protein [Planctomycetota bacterium]